MLRVLIGALVLVGAMLLPGSALAQTPVDRDQLGRLVHAVLVDSLRRRVGGITG